MSYFQNIIKYEVVENDSDDEQPSNAQSSSFNQPHNNMDEPNIQMKRKRKNSSDSDFEQTTQPQKRSFITQRCMHIGNKSAKRQSEMEMKRIQGAILKMEKKLRDPQRRVKVNIFECKVSDYHRPLNDNHLSKILQMYYDGGIKLDQEPIIVMPKPFIEDDEPDKKYVIIDGQHRWKALRRVHRKRQEDLSQGINEFSDQPTEYITAILLDKDTTLEEQRIVANLADQRVGSGMPFSDVDLIDEVVKITKFNSCFSSLRPTRRSTAKYLPFSRLYNSRLQEFHLMVAGIEDLDQREAFSDLMQAVSEGKFKKSNGNSMYINSTRIWRQIMKAFNPELENNIKIIKEAANSGGGSYDDFIEKLENEGSTIRVWLDNNNRSNVGVLEFCKKIGLENQPHDYIQKFLNSLASDISDECISKAAKTKFSKAKTKNYNVVSSFLSKSFSNSFDFVYVDMRFFQTMHSQIVNWIRNQNVRHIYLRDQNNYTTLSTPSNLNSVYQKRHLATTTLVDIHFPCGHPLRTSYLHVLSAGPKMTALDHQIFDIMLFKELFEHYFHDKSGICFVGSPDTSIHKKYMGQTNYKFVFEDEFNQNGHVSDTSQKTRDSSEHY